LYKISAYILNSEGTHQVDLRTNNAQHSIVIPPKATGPGSSANGGELLFLALATCYCNDIYREAAKRNITVKRVQVEVMGEFDEAPGSVAQNITYKAAVQAQASQQEILELMRYTDTVAEVQNTLRRAMPVTLVELEAISV
jgi:uncharacterized OsmC-like protein